MYVGVQTRSDWHDTWQGAREHRTLRNGKKSSMWIAENSDCIQIVKPLAQSSRSRSIGNELDECGPSIEIKKRHNANVCKITKINEFVFT